LRAVIRVIAGPRRGELVRIALDPWTEDPWIEKS
jgi:hypothetical protein